MKDNQFYASSHVGNCVCQWCKLDLKLGGADEPVGNSLVVHNKTYSSTERQDSNSLVDAWYDMSESSLGMYNSCFSSSVSLNDVTFSGESVHTDDSLSSCDSSVIQHFINTAKCNGSVSQYSMESVSNFGLSSESNATSRNLDNRLDIKTMAPGDSSGYSSPKLGSLHKSSEAGDNYSLINSFQGATSHECTRLDNSSKQNNMANNGFHKQWGFTFLRELPAIKNTHCRILDSSNMSNWIKQAFHIASQYNVPNYLGARIKVVSQLNTDQFRYLLSDYKFSRVLDYVEYGFPLTLDYENFNYNTDIVIHKSALEYPIAVEEYLNTEIGHKALVGPYTKPPFTKLHVSPMMTRCKPDGSRRLIVDLSWPPGESVNSRIPDNMLDGHMGILKYPTIDHIVDAITDVGKDAFLFKVDLKRAYRNLRTDPRHLSVLGLQWGNQRYVDLSVPFGLKSGASCCELVTSSISHLLATSVFGHVHIWMIFVV